jgi:hypothetical protein
MMEPTFQFVRQPSAPPQLEKLWPGVQVRRPNFAGPGRLRKVALLGGAEKTLRYAPWHDPSWELWSHASCRHRCKREPDALFDLHPPELWRDPTKKFWDKSYLKWLQQNHIPIYMQERYRDIPCSVRYPFETVITEFPRGYMTSHVAYMIALALTEGVTHIALYGCHYDSDSEYGPQRGGAEYWCGVAEGRGVHVTIPPGCDLLNRPHLLYGYQSHPGGKRDPSYSFFMGPRKLLTDKEKEFQARQKREKGLPPDQDPTDSAPIVLLKEGGDQYPLCTPPDGVKPALERRDETYAHLNPGPRQAVHQLHRDETSRGRG